MEEHVVHTNELFNVVHIQSDNIVSVFGVQGQVIEPFGGIITAEFLIWTSDGWDWRSANEFRPMVAANTLELED